MMALLLRILCAGLIALGALAWAAVELYRGQLGAACTVAVLGSLLFGLVMPDPDQCERLSRSMADDRVE